MNEFKGTKGKWFVCEMDDAFIRSKENGAFICKMDSANYKFNEKINNAKLIAHAPEMLEEINESIKDLLAIQRNVSDAYRTDKKWKGVYEILQEQIDRKKQLIKSATEVNNDNR